MSIKIKVLKPEGIIDNQKSTSLYEQVRQSVAEGNNLVVIDFHKVTLIDSAGLGTLIMIQQMIVKEGKGKLFLMSLNDQMKMLLLELTDTGQLFEIVEQQTELQERL